MARTTITAAELPLTQGEFPVNGLLTQAAWEARRPTHPFIERNQTLVSFTSTHAHGSRGPPSQCRSWVMQYDTLSNGGASRVVRCRNVAMSSCTTCATCFIPYHNEVKAKL